MALLSPSLSVRFLLMLPRSIPTKLHNAADWDQITVFSVHVFSVCARTHTHTRFKNGPLGFCPGLPGLADIRKVKQGR